MTIRNTCFEMLKTHNYNKEMEFLNKNILLSKARYNRERKLNHNNS